MPSISVFSSPQSSCSYPFRSFSTASPSSPSAASAPSSSPPQPASLSRPPGAVHAKPATPPSWEGTRPCLITTPIFYVNAAPHVGHVQSALIADAIARWCSISGRKSFLSTGTDEHGAKVHAAAVKKGVSVQTFCDDVSSSFQKTFDAFNIGYSDFIRTTQPRHHALVQQAWQYLRDKGDIYESEYSGWYAVQDEAFVTEDEIMTDEATGQKMTRESRQPVEWMTEDTYKFRLNKYKPRIAEWLAANPQAIHPAPRYNEVQSFLNSSTYIDDLSISRKRDRVPWGISVPNQDDHVIYVWLDALCNYLTVCLNNDTYPTLDALRAASKSEADSDSCLWPSFVHVIGKDIVKFHALYWPAFLLALDLPLPRQILAHAHWTVDGFKMSKSKGNVVDPCQLVERGFPAEAVRYTLLRHYGLADDADFSTSILTVDLNSDLADNLGNLLGRATASNLTPPRAIAAAALSATSGADERAELPRIQARLNNQDKQFIDFVRLRAAHVRDFYNAFEFSRGLSELMSIMYEANRYFSSNEPWVLRKALRVQETNGATPERLAVMPEFDRLGTVLHLTREALRICGILMSPATPAASRQLLDHLRVPKDSELRTAAGERSMTIQTEIDWELLCTTAGPAPILFTKVKTT